MTHLRTTRRAAVHTAAVLAAAVAVSGFGHAALAKDPTHTAWGAGADDKAFAQMLDSSFHDKGIATTDRLKQDATQRFCSDPIAAASPATAKQRAKIEATNLATVKYPTDGNWLGDWKEGEKIAQSGRGLTWSDKAGEANGGNCYNCHQLSPKEIAFGTIGPSLTNYAKNHGTDDEALRYAWGKIFNAKAYNACSNMPRAGHMGIVTEQQMKDIMALLFDPASPVNQADMAAK